MTPPEIKKTRLYRTLAPCVRKEDREELARMLAMVKPRYEYAIYDTESLAAAFVWSDTPQGYEYWSELSRSLSRAGHDCY